MTAPVPAGSRFFVGQEKYRIIIRIFSGLFDLGLRWSFTIFRLNSKHRWTKNTVDRGLMCKCEGPAEQDSGASMSPCGYTHRRWRARVNSQQLCLHIRQHQRMCCKLMACLRWGYAHSYFVSFAQAPLYSSRLLGPHPLPVPCSCSLHQHSLSK